jgi:type IV pilus assembly protein PilC
MPIFTYKVGREDGSILVKEVEAEDGEMLRHELEESGYLVLQLKRRHAFSFGAGFTGVARKIKSEDFLIFNQELMVLLKAGLPIVQSLDILLERTPNAFFKEALSDVKAEVRGGKALSDAMGKHPRFFPELYTNSLRAGERTGNLPEVLERFIAYLKQMITVKRHIISAVTYPIFLIGFTVILMAVLLTYVVPSFSEIYSDFKAELPLPTVILMNFTRFLRSYVLIFAGALVLAVYGFRVWYRTPKGRRVVDAQLLRAPLLGAVIQGYVISTMTRTLATILAGGIPMLQALEMVAKSVTNREVSQSLEYTQERVREGMSLAGALEETGIMPPMTLRMIEVGEATGALETMLNNISSFYEEEVTVKVQRLTNLIEPVIMLGLGLVVGSIVIIMYLPIFELAGTVK